MVGDHSPDIKLGAVIYGRVSGYPWWPAVVTKCPSSDQWTKGGKFWVYFFNDTTGAWLRASQIRSFDRYNHDLCQEHNSGVAKFRRYQERIDKAVSIAETHLRRSSKPLRVKVLPPKRSQVLGQGSASDIPSKDCTEHEQCNLTTGPGRQSKQEPTTTLGRESSNSDGPPAERHQSSENGIHTDADRIGTSTARPRRKRVKSIRYAERDISLESKAPPRARAQSVPEQHAQPIVISCDTVFKPAISREADERPDTLAQIHGAPPRRSMRLRPTADPSSTSGLAAKRTRRKRVRSYRQSSADERPTEVIKASILESSTSTGSLNLERSFGKPTGASTAGSQRRSKAKGSKGKGYRVLPSDSVTKEVYVAELKEVAKKSSGEFRFPSNGRRVVRGVRSLVGVGANSAKQVDDPNNCTDSEEQPERERKVTAGSLEVAAENLVEHAIKGCRSESSDPSDEVTRGHSIALSNADLVSSILNRLSNLEKDVSHLNKRTTSEEQATLGEDATAAGVKSAVDALAAASAAFAKARDYNVAVIRRSMEVLWPDGQFPLAGADGDLLRTVAQSLILASCKRRQAQLASVTGRLCDGETVCNRAKAGTQDTQYPVAADSTCLCLEEHANCRMRYHMS